MASTITPRLGFLFPGHSAEDDYPRMAAMVSPPIAVEVVHTTVGEDAHRVEALRDTGDLKRLLEGAEVLREHGVDAALWACTSGSFVFGWEGAREQVQALEKFLGVPASSTSLAFVAALQAMSIPRVAVAATYPLDIALLFSEFLERGGATVVHVGSLGIIAGVEVGAMSREEVLRFVHKNDCPDAKAILVPDTALHSAGWIDDLEAAVGGKPVLTANQVTMWEALRLAGHPGVAQAGMGTLLRRTTVAAAPRS